MKITKALNATTKAKLYKLALGAGMLTSVAVPTAILISCNNDSAPALDTTAVGVSLSKLAVNEATSTTDSLAWTNVPQVPHNLSASVSHFEYLVGDYPTDAIANASEGWSQTLPRKVSAVTDAKFWARLAVRPNYYLAKSVFDLTTSSKLAAVKAASDPNAPARTVDASAFVASLSKRLDVIDDSDTSRLAWQGALDVPSQLSADVAGVEYLVGNYQTEAAAKDASNWSATLPTSLGDTSASTAKVWARLVPQPKVTLTPEYVDLSSVARLDKLLKPAPTASGIASSWVFNSHRDVQFIASTPTGQHGSFETDRDFFTPAGFWNAYDANYRLLWRAMQLNLFRSVKPVSDINVYDDNFNLTSVTANAQTRRSQLRFELIEALVMTDESGAEHVFDKDVSANTLTPDDPRDVNSQHFKDVFTDTTVGRRIVKLQLRLRKNAPSTYWRRNFTGQNGSNVSAKDLYLGMIHSILSNSRSLVDYSGLNFNFDTPENPGTLSALTTAIGSAIVQRTLKYGLQKPQNTDAIANLLYLRSSIGLNLDPFLDLSKMNEVVKDDVTLNAQGLETSRVKDQILELTFDNASNYSAGARENFLEYFTQTTFAVIPYQETTDLLKNATVTERLRKIAIEQAKLTDDQYQRFVSSLAYKSGFFHVFLENRNNFYSAGKYYLGFGSNSEILGLINENYIDNRWTNQRNIDGSRTVIETYRIKYQLRVTGSENDWSGFQSGNAVSSTASALDNQGQKNARDFPTSYGARFTRGYSALNSVGASYYSYLTMIPMMDEDYTALYFNNNFAKVLYGATAEEMDRNLNNYTTGGIIKTLASGTGFELRKLISASMNAYSFVQGFVSEDSKVLDWTSIYPPEQGLAGSDLTQDEAVRIIDNLFPPASAPTKPPVSTIELLNNYVFEKNAAGKWVATPFTRQSYVDQSITSSFFNRYGPSESLTLDDTQNANSKISPFKVLQRAFKNLLDRTVGEYNPNDPATTRLTWEMPYERGGQEPWNFASIRAQGVYQSYKQMLKSIDPRLNVVATLRPTSKEVDATGNATYKDATVLVENWPSSSDWNALLEGSDNTNSFPNSHTNDRIGATGKKSIGVASSLSGSSAFNFDAPTEAIFTNYGGLNFGVLLLHSYYSDPDNKNELNTDLQTPLSSDLLAPLNRLVDTVRDKFNEFVSGATIQNTGFKSSYAATFVNAIKSLKFENLWKSDLKALRVYDYYGFIGLEEVLRINSAIKAKVSAGTALTEDEILVTGSADTKSDYSRVSDYLGKFIGQSVSLDVWSELKKLPTKDLLATLLAWQVVSPDNMNPLTAQIGNRGVPSLNLAKTWFLPSSSGATGNYELSVANHRVDLDYQNGYYLGLPLYKDANGEWKTAQDGGIVY